jgi:hypothetical protein
MKTMKKKILLSICAFMLLQFAVEAQTTLTNDYTTAENNNLNYLYSNLPGRVPKKRIPSAVQEAFKENFKGIKKVKWRTEEEDLFAADFINDRKENVSVYFNANGSVIEISTLKNMKNIHFSLMDKINSQLNFPEIADIVEIKDYVNNEMFYVVSVMVNDEIIEHHLDSSGNIINGEKEVKFDGAIKI